MCLLRFFDGHQGVAMRLTRVFGVVTRTLLCICKGVLNGYKIAAMCISRLFWVVTSWSLSSLDQRVHTSFYDIHVYKYCPGPSFKIHLLFSVLLF